MKRVALLLILGWCAGRTAPAQETLTTDLVRVGLRGDTGPACAAGETVRRFEAAWDFLTEEGGASYEVRGWSLGLTCANTGGAASVFTTAWEHEDLATAGPGGLRPSFHRLNFYAPGDLGSLAGGTEDGTGLEGAWGAVTQSVVLDFNQTAVLPAPATAVGCLWLDVGLTGSGAGETVLAFSDAVGSPPVSTVAVVAGGPVPPGETARYVPLRQDGVTIPIFGADDPGCLIAVEVSGDTSPVCLPAAVERDYDVVWDFPTGPPLAEYEVLAFSLGLVVENTGGAESVITTVVEHDDLAGAGPGGGRPSFGDLNFYVAGDLANRAATSQDGQGVAGQWAAVTQAVILDYDQLTVIPAPVESFGAARVTVSLSGSGTGATALEFTDAVGTPPVSTVAVVGGASLPPGETARVAPGRRTGVAVPLIGPGCPECLLSVAVTGNVDPVCPFAGIERDCSVEWSFGADAALAAYEVRGWSLGVILENEGAASSTISGAREHPDTAQAGPGGGRPAFSALSFYAPGDFTTPVVSSEDGTERRGSWAALTQAVVLDYEQNSVIPAATLGFGAVTLSVAYAGSGAGTTTLRLSDEVGDPPVPTVAIIAGGPVPPGETARVEPLVRQALAVPVLDAGSAACLFAIRLEGDTSTVTAANPIHRPFTVAWDFATGLEVPDLEVRGWSLGVLVENSGTADSYIWRRRARAADAHPSRR